VKRLLDTIHTMDIHNFILNKDMMKHLMLISLHQNAVEQFLICVFIGLK